MLELYKNIKKYRLSLGMSQEKLAKLTGYNDRSSIAKIEKGEVDIPQSKILLFADALQVDAGTLMGNSGLSPASDFTQEQLELLELFGSLNDFHKKSALEHLLWLNSQETQSSDNPTEN